MHLTFFISLPQSPYVIALIKTWLQESYKHLYSHNLVRTNRDHGDITTLTTYTVKYIILLNLSANSTFQIMILKIVQLNLRLEITLTLFQLFTKHTLIILQSMSSPHLLVNYYQMTCIDATKPSSLVILTLMYQNKQIIFQQIIF